MDKKPKNRLVSRAWETMSCALASGVVFAAFVFIAYWSLTGTSLVIDTESQLVPRNGLFAIQMMYRLSICICISVFLATYALNSVCWGCFVPAVTSAAVVASGQFATTTLFLTPIVLGALAGYYFNIYVNQRNETQAVYTGFRAIILLLCALIAITFVSPGPLPFWLVCVAGLLKCSIMLSGAFRSIWKRAPVTEIAT